jgi:ferredoxin-type protein NapH
MAARGSTSGTRLRWGFFATRVLVLLFLCLVAAWTHYLNLKAGYNNARLVELAHGPWMRRFYEASDTFFGMFGDPLESAQRSGGMVWSATIMGLPLTDPVAALSVVARGSLPPLRFALGLVLPLGLALAFGRVFCAAICPASLVFFVTSRIRRFVLRWFYLPSLSPGRGLAWGVLVGGLVLAALRGHGIWSLLLPYVAMGQTLFHTLVYESSVAGGLAAATLGALVVFALADLLLGDHFVCKYLCPTGRLLGVLGRRAPFGVVRDAALCQASCDTCTAICPLGADPKVDALLDCSLCGECLSACPTACLTLGSKSA